MEDTKLAANTRHLVFGPETGPYHCYEHILTGTAFIYLEHFLFVISVVLFTVSVQLSEQ